METGGRWAAFVATEDGNAVGDEPVVQRRGQGGGEADDHEREEDADREHLGRVLEGRVHPRRRHRGARGGRLFITPARLGEAKAPIARPFSRSIGPKVA